VARLLRAMVAEAFFADFEFFFTILFTVFMCIRCNHFLSKGGVVMPAVNNRYGGRLLIIQGLYPVYCIKCYCN
jgi:hypothetical protein